mmetsp:Transcript_14641/g.58509  ORF Transcript_14641/g.58509 Transcript_14641/m.58509 type:complete len:319 (-) Transcript_14641:7-963(-)
MPLARHTTVDEAKVRERGEEAADLVRDCVVVARNRVHEPHEAARRLGRQRRQRERAEQPHERAHILLLLLLRRGGGGGGGGQVRLDDVDDSRSEAESMVVVVVPDDDPQPRFLGVAPRQPAKCRQSVGLRRPEVERDEARRSLTEARGDARRRLREGRLQDTARQGRRRDHDLADRHVLDLRSLEARADVVEGREHHLVARRGGVVGQPEPRVAHGVGSGVLPPSRSGPRFGPSRRVHDDDVTAGVLEDAIGEEGVRRVRYHFDARSHDTLESGVDAPQPRGGDARRVVRVERPPEAGVARGAKRGQLGPRRVRRRPA